MSLLFSLRRVGGACLLLLAGAVNAGPAVLMLREQVVVDHAGIVLGDLLVSGGGLPYAALDIGHAPRVGYTVRLTRAELNNQLRRHFPEAIVHWEGATVVTVRTKAQGIDSVRVREAVLERVRATFAEPGTLVDVEMPEAMQDIPAGQYALRARPLSAGAPAARLPVWVDVVINDAVYRSIIVTARVHRDGDALVARRALDAGSRIAPEDFAIERVNIAGVDAVVPADLSHDGARLRVPLRPGQILGSHALAPAGAIFHGDQVLVSVRGGAVDVEALAVAQGPALPGQFVSLRASSSGETLRGRVTRAGRVVIE